MVKNLPLAQVVGMSPMLVSLLFRESVSPFEPPTTHSLNLSLPLLLRKITTILKKKKNPSRLMVARDRRVWNGDWEMLQRIRGKLGGLMDMFYFLNYDD